MASYRRNLLVLLVQSYITYFLLIWLIISPLLFEPCLALYEDQVGKFDWKQQYIGAVKFAHFDYGSSSRRIIVASERNVLAAINPATSQIVWRQLLEPSTIGTIHALGGTTEIITVTGIEALVRSWDATTGRLNWETSLTLPDRNEEPVDSVFYKVNSKEQIVTVVERHRKTSSFEVRRHHYRTGKMVSSFRVAAPWFDETTSSCEIISSVYFVCLNVRTRTIYSLMLDRATTFWLTPLSTLGITNLDVDSKMVPLIRDDVNVQHLFAVKLAADRFAVLMAKELTSTEKAINVVSIFEQVSDVSATQTDEEILLFLLSQSSATRENTLKVFSVTSNSYLDGLEDTLSYPEHHGRPDKVFVHVVPKRDGGYGYRLLIRTESQSVILVQPTGKMVWAREEALASILSVEMVDLPVSESDAQVEEQFENANAANIMIMFYKRLTSHFFQLQSFFTRLLLGLHKDVTGAVVTTEQTKLVRDEFNIHKIVVLATAVGKVYGIDSRTGSVLWQQFVPQLAPHERYRTQKLPLYVLRTTAHHLQQPLCVVLGLNKQLQQSVLFVFNPITGQPLDGKNGLIQLDFRIVQTIQLPQHNTEFIRGLVLIDQQYKVHVYPRSIREVALSLAKVLYVFVADVDTGELHGLSLRFSTSKELIAGRVWGLTFPAPKNTITNVVMKRPIEHVHSQGRVMTDRSVLYKYLNPNLAVVTTEEKNSDKKLSSFSIYLVDVVSGNIIFSAVHKKARGPVHVVHSENWIVYMFYCEKYHRVEASVLELYEGKVQSNTTAFSSLTPPPIPMVEQQAYIFMSPADAIAVTNTEKGITSKHLLLALPMGGIVELPKSFLDPRRSLFPTQEQREEGIIPYIPELPIPAENVINYNQSVFRIRGIYTSSTGLESTSLVLAYGLDLFYTRVTPSRTFDVLKDDFDHWLIVAVLSALIIASYVSKVLAARKALKQAWK